jgi:putative transposase
MADQRICLIERLCRLPEGDLAKVESFLNELDQSHAAPPAAVKDWPHAPVHRLSEHGTYIVTTSTTNKDHLFRGEAALSMLEKELLLLAKHHCIQLEAWAVFSNHYHFVAHTGPEKNQMTEFISHLHTKTATEINRLDNTPGREVWFNFWDTQLTFEKSYFARLNYVHHNAVKHGLVRRAADYRWCSAFESTATRPQVQTIYSFKIDRVKIEDDYEPVL